MHRGDLVNVESGDMFINKQTIPVGKQSPEYCSVTGSVF
jgi:hypothetical protein